MPWAQRQNVANTDMSQRGLLTYEMKAEKLKQLARPRHLATSSATLSELVVAKVAAELGATSHSQ